MSGKHYGAINVRQEADDEDDTDLSPTAADDAAKFTAERIPLLSSLTQETETIPPPSFSSTTSPRSSVSVAVQTDPSKLTIALRRLSKIWSYTTFDWISPLLATGNANGQLNLDDLDELPLPDDCETSQVYAKFLQCWNDELDKARRADVDNNNGNNDDEFSRLVQPTTTAATYQPSLIKALARAFGEDFLRAGLLKLIHDSNLFVGPQVLNHLIQFLRDADAPIHRGVALTLIVTVSQIAMSISLRHYFFKCYNCGLQVRTAVVLAVYKKSLHLSLKERHSFGGGEGGGPGEIVNLVGIDAQRMQDLMTYLHAVWYSFYQIGLALFFLWGQVGASCLAGVIVIVVLIPVTKFIAGWLSGVQKVLMKARDERVSLNNELMNSMKIVKIQAWEENFRSKLTKLRNYEMNKLTRYFTTAALSITMFSATPLLVSLATFGAYTMIQHQHLDVAQALTALALFDILRFPLNMLPQIINRIIEAGISFERVRKFLLAEECRSVGEGTLEYDGEIYINNGTFVYDSKKPTLMEAEGKKKGGIGGLLQKQTRLMQEAQLNQQWEMALLKAQLIDAEKTIAKLTDTDGGISSHSMPMNEEEGGFEPSSLLSLRRVTMQVKRGEFVAVVGGVGAGKSTLINSILGEGRPLTGTELAVKGKLGTFVQSPFILNDTVRNNILFGHAPISKSSKGAGGEVIDEDRYKLAVEVSSLKHDFTLLPHGDQTEIGEKGITLSGGQKARVAIARTIYHDADVYLLDDPLAAVDAHVGTDIFNKCIVDEMLLGKSKGNTINERNATVILVTNALQYLSHEMVDKIICLEDGRVQEVGTFAELSSDPKSRFSAFLNALVETSRGAMASIDDDEEDEQDIDDISANLDGNSKVPTPSSPKRKMSIQSVDDATEVESSDGALMTDEFKEREKGEVDSSVYIAWSRAAGGVSVGVSLIFMYMGVECLQVLSKWWLTHWSQSGGSNVVYYLGMYAVINFSAIIATCVRLLMICFAGIRASRVLFNDLLDVILRAPMSFFDTTPIGRIMNRFSKDMYTVDEQLVVSARSYFATMVTVLSTIVVVTSVTPQFIFGLIPLLFFYVQQQKYFTMSYRELKRLDSITRSPIYALLSETLDGVLTIRAFGAGDHLNKRMINMVNTQQGAYRLTYAAQCWLSIRLEFCGTMIIFVACFVSILHNNRSEVYAGLAGLSISFALSITQSLNWTVRMASDLEANMVAVERIQQYSQIPTEAPRLTEADGSLPYNWPAEGRIEFIGAKLRYRRGLPLVLKGLNITIPARAKVGVVGRTGAGKSTLMVALLRLVELDSGRIKIDGVDISQVGLRTLRTKIAVIPQDPSLFSGSVRSNLDPFDEYDDDTLYEVLEKVGLYNSMTKNYSSSNLKNSSNSLTSIFSGESSSHVGGRAQPIKSLSEAVMEGGTNYSVGQRQLMVIARAMLTGAQVVIMDEATASVDGETDAKIQRLFREEFKNATCITVAHRLNTIMDSDLVLVMDDGRAAEFDRPSALLSREGGMFKALVEASEE